MKFSVNAVKYSFGAFLLVVASIAIFVGLYFPPQGVLDGSVLIAVGEILGFVGAMFGIYFKFSWKDKEIIVKNMIDKEED
jgi:hypothetical protein